MGDRPPLLPTWKLALAIAGLLAVCAAAVVVSLLPFRGLAEPEVPAVNVFGDGTVFGFVRDDEGAAVEGVQITLERCADSSQPGARPAPAADVVSRTESNSDGLYLFSNVPDGNVRIHPEKAGYDVPTVEVRIDSEHRRALSIDLVAHRSDRAGGGIRGRVVCPEELIVPDRIDVRATRLDGTRTDGRRRDRQIEAVRDDGFAFELLDLDPGRYELAIDDWGSPLDVPHAQRIVEVTVGIVQADLEVPLPDPARTIGVRVVDPDGKPVWPESMKVLMSGPNWRGEGGSDRLRRADGGYFLPHPFADRTVTACAVDMTSEQYGRYIVAVELPRTLPVLVRLEAPATLRIAGEGLPAGPVTTAPVVDLKSVGGGPQPHDSAPAAHGTLDAVGRARLGPLRPGAYFLSVSDGAYPHRVLQSRRVELVSGVNDVTIPLGDCSCTLTVDAGAARKFWFATLHPRGERTKLATEQTDETGRVVFGCLCAGTYDVEIDGETRHVDVAANTTLTW